MPLLEYGIFPHLLGNDKGSDLTFIVENQAIPAHSNILQGGRAGPYLAALLAHPFKESRDRKVPISEVSHRIFNAILQYIYTGRTVVYSAQDLANLCCAADRFQVTTLLPYIKPELLLSLTAHLPNPDDLLKLIQQMRSFPALSQAVQICVKGVLANWAAAKASESWRTMVGGPEAREVFELFMEEAAELQKKSME
ncbi:BTB/POZ domain-containing protein 9 [Borealophlyctis nickersoniae]|nr:BTB/POZ domain-containing protein 9 [Borealophlyctis nickersoniae]